jgi:peptide/nickel transport system permease protein
LARNRSARVGALIAGVLVVLAAAAPWLAPHDPEQTVGRPLQSPTATHWLGTDESGQDVWSRVLHGSRRSLLAGWTSIALAMALGVPAGLVAGYAGGWLDGLIMRAVDLVLAFPAVLVALVVVVALGPGWTAVILAIGLVNVPIFCRQVRASVLSLRHQEFVLASRAAGAGPGHVLLRTILPSLVSPVVVLAALGLGTAILEVAGLSFLGVAGEPNAPEWGWMLRTAKEALHTSLWPALGPGAAISLSVLGFCLLGDGLRDALDPREAAAASGRS